MIYSSFSTGCGFMILTNLTWLMHDCKPEVKDILIPLVLSICISQHIFLFFIYLLFCMINTVLQLKQFSDICRHGKVEVPTGLIIFLPRFIIVRLQSVKHHSWTVFSKELPLFLWNVEQEKKKCWFEEWLLEAEQHGILRCILPVSLLRLLSNLNQVLCN